jgi:hypothetical protein
MLLEKISYLQSLKGFNSHTKEEDGELKTFSMQLLMQGINHTCMCITLDAATI